MPNMNFFQVVQETFLVTSTYFSKEIPGCNWVISSFLETADTCILLRIDLAGRLEI